MKSSDIKIGEDYAFGEHNTKVTVVYATHAYTGGWSTPVAEVSEFDEQKDRFQYRVFIYEGKTYRVNVGYKYWDQTNKKGFIVARKRDDVIVNFIFVTPRTLKRTWADQERLKEQQRIALAEGRKREEEREAEQRKIMAAEIRGDNDALRQFGLSLVDVLDEGERSDVEQGWYYRHAQAKVASTLAILRLSAERLLAAHGVGV